MRVIIQFLTVIAVLSVFGMASTAAEEPQYNPLFVRISAYHSSSNPSNLGIVRSVSISGRYGRRSRCGAYVVAVLPGFGSTRPSDFAVEGTRPQSLSSKTGAGWVTPNRREAAFRQRS